MPAFFRGWLTGWERRLTETRVIYKRQWSTQPQGKAGKDDGIAKIQGLLITWLTEDPSLFGRLRGFLTPEDFSEGIYRDVASLVYEGMKKPGSGTARIISCFQSAEEQSKAAALFNAGLLEK